MDLQNVKNITITEGNVNTIHDKDGKLLWGRLAYDTKYAGDTFQQTYSGKNLFGGLTYEAKSNITSWDLTNNILTITPSYTDRNPSITFTLDNPLPAGTYTLNSNNFISSSTQLRENAGSMGGGVNFNNYYSEVTRTTTASTPYITFNWVATGSLDPFTVDLSTLQIVAGSTAGSYEPYVGGTPSPNPDYPQDIDVVTGEQTVNVHGKNLLPNGITSQSFHGVTITKNADGSLILNGLVESGEPNYYLTLGSFSAVSGVKYTISGVMGWDYNTLQLFGVSSVAFPAGNRIQSYNGPQTVTAQGDENVIIRLFIYPGQNYENVVIYPMVEQSASATTYEPYQGSVTYTVDLGSTELCKIGTYQDYIYKSGDDWYVHKDIGKYTFDGNESWQAGAYGTNPWILSNVISTSYDTSKIQVMSEVFRGVSNDDRSTSGNNVIYTTSNVQIYVRNTSITTLADIQSATNGTDLYYAIATPTDTKITDNTLIGQLNAIHKWLTRYGYSSSITGNLPMIINQTNL